MLMSCSRAGGRDGQVGVVAVGLCEELLRVASEHAGVVDRSRLAIRCALMHDTASSSQDLMALATAGCAKHERTVLSAVVALEEPAGGLLHWLAALACCTGLLPLQCSPSTGLLHWPAVTGRRVADCQLLVLGGDGAFSAHEWSSGDAVVMLGQHTEHYWWVTPRHNLPPGSNTCLSTPQILKDASSDI